MSFRTLNLTQPEAPRWEAAEENCHTAGATSAWKLTKYDDMNDWRNEGKDQCMLCPRSTMVRSSVCCDKLMYQAKCIGLNQSELTANSTVHKWYKKRTHLYQGKGPYNCQTCNLSIRWHCSCDVVTLCNFVMHQDKFKE